MKCTDHKCTNTADATQSKHKECHCYRYRNPFPIFFFPFSLDHLLLICFGSAMPQGNTFLVAKLSISQWQR
eukprot:c21474_g1_i1 orf=912-1124(-)